MNKVNFPIWEFAIFLILILVFYPVILMAWNYYHNNRIYIKENFLSIVIGIIISFVICISFYYYENLFISIFSFIVFYIIYFITILKINSGGGG